MLSGASNTIGELKMNGGTFGVSQLAREEATAKVGKLTGTRGSINLLHSTLTLTGTDNTISSGLKLVGSGTVALAEGKSLAFDGSNTIGDAIYIDGTRNGTLHITQGTLAFTNQARMEIATLALDSAASTLNAGTLSFIPSRETVFWPPRAAKSPWIRPIPSRGTELSRARARSARKEPAP